MHSTLQLVCKLCCDCLVNEEKFTKVGRSPTKTEQISKTFTPFVDRLPLTRAHLSVAFAKYWTKLGFNSAQSTID